MITTLSRPGPTTTASPTASSRLGKAIAVSVSRLTTLSIHPPR